MATPTAADRRAARRYGPSVNRIAARYINPYTGKRLSGAALLLKVASGESGFSDDAVSSTGARGRTQFTAGSRATAVQKFGVDPWHSPDEAYHAAALHLRGKINGSTGLEGYNPGSASYPSYILHQKVGKSGGSSAGGAVQGTSGLLGTAGAQNIALGSADPTALLAALSQAKPAPSGSTLQSPSFSAQPVLPKGAQVPQSGGGPAPPVNIDALLGQIRTPGGNVDLAPGYGAVAGGYGSSPTGRGNGRVVLAPGADRAGARTHSDILNFAREVSGVAGETLRIGTGTSHSRLTVNGNVSEHWGGHAVDIPATGKRLVRLGQDALIAAGMDPKKARRQTGGLYNLTRGGRRFQIIFATKEGGDHFTHVHLGIGRG